MKKSKCAARGNKIQRVLKGGCFHMEDDKEFRKQMEKMSEDGKNAAWRRQKESWEARDKKRREIEIKVRQRVIDENRFLSEEEIIKEVQEQIAMEERDPVLSMMVVVVFAVACFPWILPIVILVSAVGFAFYLFIKLIGILVNFIEDFYKKYKKRRMS